MKLFRVKIPVVVEMVFGDDEVKNKAEAIERVVAICSDDSTIVTEIIAYADESLVTYEETDTEAVSPGLCPPPVRYDCPPGYCTGCDSKVFHDDTIGDLENRPDYQALVDANRIKIDEDTGEVWFYTGDIEVISIIYEYLH